jgi:hypothetical protein
MLFESPQDKYTIFLSQITMGWDTLQSKNLEYKIPE